LRLSARFLPRAVQAAKGKPEKAKGKPEKAKGKPE
jgi:hypothetical protein